MRGALSAPGPATRRARARSGDTPPSPHRVPRHNTPPPSPLTAASFRGPGPTSPPTRGGRRAPESAAGRGSACTAGRRPAAHSACASPWRHGSGPDALVPPPTHRGTFQPAPPARGPAHNRSSPAHNCCGPAHHSDPAHAKRCPAHKLHQCAHKRCAAPWNLPAHPAHAFPRPRPRRSLPRGVGRKRSGSGSHGLAVALRPVRRRSPVAVAAGSPSRARQATPGAPEQARRRS